MGQNRTALVTGGAQGIGRGITERLLDDGWQVMVADIDAEAGEEFVAGRREARDRLHFTTTDVADEREVARCVEETLRLGGRLDAVVNNAGIAYPYGRPVWEQELADWNRLLAVNLTGAFLVVKHAAPYLKAARGAVVNIASTRALQSEPHTEAYAASKGGLVALTHALAMSLGPDVRVNCVSPGWVEVRDWRKQSLREAPMLSAADHAQHPAGRVGAPPDVAHLTAFLLSVEAGFITGQNFVVDGGMTKKMIYWEE